jgi:hypothetical protein
LKDATFNESSAKREHKHLSLLLIDHGKEQVAPQQDTLMISWFRRQWIIHRKTALVCSATSFLLVLLSIVLILVTDWWRPPVILNWAKPEWIQEIDRCQSTLFQLFRAGCPPSCKRAVGNETMYPMTVECYFGQPVLFEDSQLPNAYERVIN